VLGWDQASAGVWPLLAPTLVFTYMIPSLLCGCRSASEPFAGAGGVARSLRKSHASLRFTNVRASRNVISSGPLADRVVLAHELVEAAVSEHAVAVLVGVYAVRRAWNFAVEEQAEGNRLARSGREDEVRVAGVVPVPVIASAALLALAGESR